MRSLFLIITFIVSLHSASYVIATSTKSNIENTSVRQIKDIFLMKRHFIGDQRVVPVNMLSSSDLRKVFEKSVLKTDREKLNNYWIKQHFQGISPPVTQASANSLKLFLKNVNGAIGYLPKELLDTDLKVLYEF